MIQCYYRIMPDVWRVYTPGKQKETDQPASDQAMLAWLPTLQSAIEGLLGATREVVSIEASRAVEGAEQSVVGICWHKRTGAAINEKEPLRFNDLTDTWLPPLPGGEP